ncbi:DUF484 family protein [Thalassotalea marina]|uniref:DUF484 domain-containing protein n=1 Tax=Thalassotalea marina TaxID=1673741 RepID=A0A919BI08_9GAMM|nr:DUF484 family protein [Thalassotalea marina]GHF88834.1 DUF484 domain-containing protein [Thalassotalea marina]
MSKQENPSSTLLTDAPLSELDVELTDQIILDYLADNPEFFDRNNDIITSLRLNDMHRGTVSLVERQQQLLRSKVHSLEEEITQLLAVANQNEQLFALYSDLYLRLIDSQSLSELLDCLYRATTELLSLKDLKVWLFDHQNVEHSSVVTEDCSALFTARLTDQNYYFGRIQQSEQTLVFGQHCEGSVVLIKLEHNDQNLGFIAISSQDADHFDPRMDTLLLEQFRKLIAKLIVRISPA